MTMRIYFDANATTPLCPEALAAMLPILQSVHGNPSSLHEEGVTARYHLEKARKKIAQLLRVGDRELIFTSGGTEANNLALRGMCTPGDHLVVGEVEHPAVYHTGFELLRDRVALNFLGVNTEGRYTAEFIRKVVRPDTAVVAIMLANNETGTINPVGELAEEIRRIAPQARIHCDAVQALGKMPFRLSDLGVDTVAFAAHKFHGPKGVGLLWVRPETRLRGQLSGGGQEHKLRGGTENVAGAVGMAAAMEVALAGLEDRMARWTVLREVLVDLLRQNLTERLTIHTPLEGSLPNTLNLGLEGHDARTLVRELSNRGVAVSAGSACSSLGERENRVIIALGVDREGSTFSLRCSMDWDAKEAQVEEFAKTLSRIAHEQSGGQFPWLTE